MLVKKLLLIMAMDTGRTWIRYAGVGKAVVGIRIGDYRILEARRFCGGKANHPEAEKT
jgi:hypothetical protein